MDDQERAEFEKWAKTLRWDLRLAPASLYPRQPPRYDVTFVQSGWLSWQACAASLRATMADRDAERLRLVEALQRLADAADVVGVKFFDTDTMDEPVEEMQAATQEARAALSDQPQHQGDGR